MVKGNRARQRAGWGVVCGESGGGAVCGGGWHAWQGGVRAGLHFCLVTCPIIREPNIHMSQNRNVCMCVILQSDWLLRTTAAVAPQKSHTGNIGFARFI